MFWFSLDTRYGHGCHLANRFCLEPNDYEVLIVVAGLAHYTRFGFAMMSTAWRKFSGGGGDEKKQSTTAAVAAIVGAAATAMATAAVAMAVAAMAEAEKATVAFCTGDDSNERRR